MQVINLEGGPDPALQLLFPAKIPNSSFVTKNNYIKKNYQGTLIALLGDSYLPLKRTLPRIPNIQVKKIPHPALEFWRIPLPRYL